MNRRVKSVPHPAKKVSKAVVEDASSQLKRIYSEEDKLLADKNKYGCQSDAYLNIIGISRSSMAESEPEEPVHQEESTSASEDISSLIKTALIASSGVPSDDSIFLTESEAKEILASIEPEAPAAKVEISKSLSESVFKYVCAGEVEELENLIGFYPELKVDTNKLRFENGLTCLHLSCFLGHIQVTQVRPFNFFII